ncbi:hypothetical protein H1R20_g7487, partial [Candolleomyces eurysporus]
MYQAAQPTPEQRHAWRSAVTSLLSVDGNCSALTVPPALEEIYLFHAFPAGGSQKTYCVLIERSVDSKGWGSVIVPESKATVTYTLHLSAPHPHYDLGTVEQAAALFELVGAKSLLIAGRTRTALMEPSQCVIPKGSQPYYVTDPAHNNLEPFFDAALAIYEWQHAQSTGCPSSSCAFIQMHGKGRRTCPSDQVFMSSGLRNNSWYTSSTDYPIKRLKRNLQYALPPKWTISLPSDSKCGLTATTNVVGRYINGIPESKVCSSSPAPSQVTGEFIHIEQAPSSRSREVYELWARALRATFQPSTHFSDVPLALDPSMSMN